jgi:hypothetical protein
MQRIVRALGCCVLVSSLAACVVESPQAVAPPAAPNPHEIAVHRYAQVEGRLNDMSHHIDQHVDRGYYPPREGDALHHRLDMIRQQANQMAAQRGGGLSGDEQRTLNDELDTESIAINR